MMGARPRVLVVARMSPRRNTRTRTLMRALSGAFEVDAISESTDRLTQARFCFEGGHLEEKALPLAGRAPWHASGLVHVVALNVYGLQQLFRGHYQIVVCSDSLYIWTGVLGKLLKGCRFVYNAHEMMWALGNSAPVSLVLAWLEKLALSTCDLWLVPSEERAELMVRRHGVKKPYLVYENLPLSLGAPSDRETYRLRFEQYGIPLLKPIVMFQGSLSEKRGIEQLVEAAKSGQFHLVIQGSGTMLPQLQKSQHQHMTLLPSCPNDETVSWTSAADLSFVYYENDCLNSAYACSNKLYTAVYAGTPVLCNPLPSFEAFSAKYGGVAFFDNLDATHLTQAIVEVLSVEGLHARLKHEMLLARGHFCKEPRESRILRAIERLLPSSLQAVSNQ